MRILALLAALLSTVAQAQPAPPEGAAIYRDICQGCHMADAKGAEGAGRYPALAGNPRLGASTYPIFVLLRGRNAMPSFAGMDDASIAAVVNHVRSHFGNDFKDAVTPDDVRKMRTPQ